MNSPVKLNARPVPQYGQGSGVTSEDLEFMAEVIGRRSHLSDGQEVARFEQAFCDATGAKHAVAVTSCTMALELTSRILGLEPGDEIITTSLTFQATVSAYVGSGVRVKFADIDPNTLCLDADSVASLVTPRTKAIITVHYGGLCGDIAELRDLADQFGLWLIEDCAHALGASVDGRSAGTWGDIGCWSFHSLKNISTLGQGGMLTTSDATLADRLRRLRTIEPDADFVRRRAADLRGFPPSNEPESGYPREKHLQPRLRLDSFTGPQRPNE